MSTPIPGYPVIVVQVQFTAGVWTTLSNPADNVSFTRGRQYERATPQAGTMSLTFVNWDGSLDPTNTASPYWPNVKLMVPIRLRATFGGTTYSLFTGFVERWPQRWGEAGNGQWTDLVAVDAFAPLSQQTLEPAFYEQMKLSNPLTWLPMDDQKGATKIGSRPAGLPSGTVRQDGVPNLVLGGQATALGIVGRTQPVWTRAYSSTGDNTVIVVPGTPQSPVVPAVGAWTVTFGINCTGGATDAAYPFLMSDTTQTQALLLSIVGNNVQLTVGTGSQPGGVGGTSASSPTGALPRLDDGVDHFVAISRATDGRTYKVCVDGVAYPAATVVMPVAMTLPFSTASVGGAYLAYINHNQYCINGSMSQYATFGTDLIANLGVANNTLSVLDYVYRSGLSGQPTDQRFSTTMTFATLAGLTSRVVAPGNSAMQASKLAGKTTTQALLDTAAAENGYVYVDASGVVVFTNRAFRYNPTPALVFGELAAELHYSDVTVDYDLTRVFNQVTVTQPNGTVVTVSSPASKSAYGTRTLTQTLDVTSAGQVADAASYLLGIYQEPMPRIPTLTLDPVGDSTLWPAVLGTDLNTPIKISRRPSAGVGFTRTCWVEKITTIITATGSFTTKWELSPADVNHYFVLGDPVLGVLGTNNYLAY